MYEELIEKILQEAESVLSDCIADSLHHKNLIKHAIPIQNQLKKVLDLFAIADPENPVNFDIGILSVRTQALGYKLYRMRDHIQFLIQLNYPHNPGNDGRTHL